MATKKVKYTMSGPDGQVSAGVRTMSQANHNTNEFCRELELTKQQ